MKGIRVHQLLAGIQSHSKREGHTMNLPDSLWQASFGPGIILCFFSISIKDIFENRKWDDQVC